MTKNGETLIASENDNIKFKEHLLGLKIGMWYESIICGRRKAQLC
jgi:hypothetical protein